MRLKPVIYLLIFLIAFTGCLQNDETADSKTNFTEISLNSTLNSTQLIVDDFGYAISLNSTPERIISLAPSNTEILYALGVGDKVVAVTDYCNFPPEAKNKTKIGGYSTVNVEKVISLNPDLVVASYGNGKETVEFLRNYVPVIALNPQNLSDVMKDIELLGRATGQEENATKIIEMMREKIKEIKKRHKPNESRELKVAHRLWHDPIWVSGKNTFIDEIITIAGGENVFDFEGWRIVSEEDLIEKNPDVIIVNAGTGMSKGRNIIYEEVMNLRIKAVDEGHVYTIDPDIISRPSYRLVYALEEIANILNEVKSNVSEIEN
jgi:iron complex transport system substrate-binding protein